MKRDECTLEWMKHPSGTHESAMTAFDTLYVASSEGWRHISSVEGVWNLTGNLAASKNGAQKDYNHRVFLSLKAKK